MHCSAFGIVSLKYDEGIRGEGVVVEISQDVLPRKYGIGKQSYNNNIL